MLDGLHMGDDPKLTTPIRPLLEVAQVAHRLNFSQEHVRRLIRKKQLPAIWFETRWRIDPLDLQAYIDKRRQGHGSNGQETTT